MSTLRSWITGLLMGSATVGGVAQHIHEESASRARYEQRIDMRTITDAKRVQDTLASALQAFKDPVDFKIKRQFARIAFREVSRFASLLPEQLSDSSKAECLKSLVIAYNFKNDLDLLFPLDDAQFFSWRREIDGQWARQLERLGIALEKRGVAVPPDIIRR
jgi:hypothetical protein